MQYEALSDPSFVLSFGDSVVKMKQVPRALPVGGWILVAGRWVEVS